ncbi:hypothetical protein LAZ67_14002132 [Cordylochernes scorpioides]|uniref:CCHC-type domain-containing protein n=1 Tax=Cordylochernes scorpioides TaxID=51811 RepID=A0ABY6L9B2_9ARAC|nr:hypothetical protein LAZ67_14002132 [Cordylochernes scorpioides]
MADEFRIPKLDGNNYYSWAIRTKSILIQKDIWDAIEPGFPRETTEKQKRKDSLALSVILLAVEDSFLDDIGDCKRAIDAWQMLEDIHTKYGLLHILQLLREFFNIVKRNDEDMKEYFARIMECHRKLAKCHHGFGDGELALIMLLGLPKSYEPLILSLEQQEEKLSTSVVKSKLPLEEKRQKQRQIPREDPNSAFAVRKKEDTCKSPCQERKIFEYDQPRNYHNTWTEGKRENYNYPRQIRCFSCGRLGHIARNCRSANSSRRISEGISRQIRCFSCGRLGHIARNCRSANSSRRISEGISRQIRCFSCGRLGHIARNCRFANSSRRISEGMLKQGTLDLTHKVLFANGFEDNNSQNIWFLDSGATEHVTSNRLKLTNTKSISSSVEMANNEKIKVSEMGDVTIKLGHEYGGETLFLENVLYVPELDGNILSVGRIEERGNKKRKNLYSGRTKEGEYQNEAAIPRGYSGTDGETISVEKDLNNLERREDGEQAYEDEALRREDEGQNETIIPRRSSRISARQKEYCRSAFHRGIVEHKSHQDEMPSSYEEALNMPKAQNRLRSIECEMASLREHRVWDVDLPGRVKRRPNQDLDHSRPPMRRKSSTKYCFFPFNIQYKLKLLKNKKNEIPIAKFDGDNFPSWKYRVESILESKDLINFLIEYPPGEESERQKWKIKDSQAKGIITCAMTDSQVSLILTCKTSKQIWASLTKRYEGVIEKKSIEARMYPEESWKDYLHRSEKLLENARIMGATIDDEEFIYSVIKGLPQKYNIIAMQINTMNNPTLSDIKSQFSLYQERYHEKDFSSSSAYKASQSESKKFYTKNKFKYKPECYICNKRGHKANDCWHNPKNKGNNNRREDLNKASTSGYKPKFGNQQKQTGNSHNEKAANCLIAKNQDKSEQEWIIDSGATSHITSCFELLKDSENKERKIILADDTQIESKAIGNVKIKTKEENLLILKDVLFVP